MWFPVGSLHLQPRVIFRLLPYPKVRYYHTPTIAPEVIWLSTTDIDRRSQNLRHLDPGMGLKLGRDWILRRYRAMLPLEWEVPFLFICCSPIAPLKIFRWAFCHSPAQFRSQSLIGGILIFSRNQNNRDLSGAYVPLSKRKDKQAWNAAQGEKIMDAVCLRLFPRVWSAKTRITQLNLHGWQCHYTGRYEVLGSPFYICAQYQSLLSELWGMCSKLGCTRVTSTTPLYTEENI